MITMLLMLPSISMYLVMTFAHPDKYYYWLKIYSINSSNSHLATIYDYGALFSSLFIHANITHIVMNMIALFQFGSLLERQISAKLLIFVYFSAGIVGSLFSVYYVENIDNTIYVLGASGAIFGLMAFHGILNYGIFAVIGEFLLFHVIVFVLRLPIAWYAHLGGALVGILFAYMYVIFNKRSNNEAFN